jgi:hypothetical protein
VAFSEQMNQPGDGTENVECNEIVYRALKRNWISDSVVAAEAFIRRIKNDGLTCEEYVSLSRRKYSTARECRMKLKKMPGTASLHVGRIRDLPFALDIHPEPINEESSGAIVDASHCSLINLPNPIDDYDNAEYVAGKIAKIVRLVSAAQEEEEHSQRRSTI